MVKELKYRLIYILVTYVLTYIVIVLSYENILSWVIEPILSIKEGKILTRDIKEGFVFRVWLSGIWGLIMVIPMIMYEKWCYVIPSKKSKERKLEYKNSCVCVVVLLMGCFVSKNLLIRSYYIFFELWLPKEINWELELISAMKVLAGLSISIIIILSIVVWYIRSENILERKKSLLSIVMSCMLFSPGDIISGIGFSIVMFVLYEILTFMKIIRSRMNV